MLVWSRGWDKLLPDKRSGQFVVAPYCIVVIRLQSTIWERRKNIVINVTSQFRRCLFFFILFTYSRDFFSWNYMVMNILSLLFLVWCHLFVVLPLHSMFTPLLTKQIRCEYHWEFFIYFLLSHEFSSVINDVQFSKFLNSSNNHLDYDCERWSLRLSSTLRERN